MLKIVRNFLSKFPIMAELLEFLWKEKMWWLVPMVVVLLIFGFLLIFVQTSAVAPFVYPLF